MANQSFSMPLALSLGNLCKQAYSQYETQKKGEAWSVADGYQFLTTLHGVYEDNAIPIGFMAKKGNDLYVAWRGTDNVEEWIIDIKFEQVNCPFFDESIKLELGFSELYGTGHGSTHPSPRDACLEQIKKEKGIETIYVTGHSLGGALAAINALDIVTQFNTAPVVYTFASPRTGNHHFAHCYNERINHSWRIVNSHDEVPKLPPKSCPPVFHEYHYKHVNNEHIITFGDTWNLPFDHSLTNYLDKLEKLSA
ncbi:lipase family protein [Endozoicomonas sp. Mp262]|uniref:lipase family protein n=1 Tax=Endozoicomonas sp. Mp262 TaxID=2919499 RepID=UPI0021E065EA